ncbi:MAG: polysaccharide deacetylase family protein [Deltaproteobacteria bacterium]|nr:polysaccharide deacetylase family protein [Deltaproteobacteria bacterium]
MAERLGFDASDRVAVIHTDDMGMCHAANEGAFEALENGPATSGSIMVPCPSFREAADRAKANPGLDLGVHLTLNAEWEHYRWGPVAGRSAVPSLLDDQGFLLRTTLETVQHAKPEEVEIELRAQVDAALDAGIDVTHIDSHMGTCFFPQFIEIYGRLALDYRVPVFAVRPSEKDVKGSPREGGLAKLAAAVDAVAEKGAPICDRFDADSLDFAEGKGEEHNRARLAAIEPGINYLICHPSKGGEELTAITPDSAHQRDFERRFYGGEAGREALAAAGVKTVGMRPLRDLMRAG